LKMMWRAIPDIGALKIYKIELFNRTIYFVNLFAANDPTSTIKVYNSLKLRDMKDYKVVLICNSRADRLDRIEQYKEILGRELVADYYILTGAFTEHISDELVKKGVPEKNIFEIKGNDPKEVFDKVLELGFGILVAVGVGNIGGMGHRIVKYFSTRGEECLRLP
ncbi:MAG: hypothetical protein ACPL6C_01150, partial [bacterium]